MIKQLNKKVNKVMAGVGAVVLVGLGIGSQTAKADSPADNQSSNYQTQLNEHKDLQAYTHPLIAAELNTALDSLPNAEEGISNWNTLPAGTTAKWNMEPDISKAGRSYGQVIVTFPDGSQSPLAVYVNTKEAKDDGEQAPSTNNQVNEENKSQASTQQQAKSNQSAEVIVRDEKPVVMSNASETTTPKSQSSEINDETSHLTGDATLPQTNSKSIAAALVAGLMMVALSLFGIAKSLVRAKN